MAGSETLTAARWMHPELDRCVHCGLCLSACPTYRVLGREADSPRGRIYQMIQLAHGNLPLSASVIRHLDLCVACRGCESACPSGVRYGELIEHARTLIEQTSVRPTFVRLARRLALRHLVLSPVMLRSAARLLWVYQRAGCRTVVRKARLLPSKLALADQFAPEIEPPSFYRYYGQTLPAQGTRRGRVGFFAGCIANVACASLNRATVRVLRRLGYDVWIPARQTCCGALHAHAGLREDAQKLARQNVDVFLAEPCDAIVSNAAGCGAALKSYADWLASDPVYVGKAKVFVQMVRDVTEFLDATGVNGQLRPLKVRVTYQDPCHLAHVQKLREAPRRLLRAVPGLELREMLHADLCCGSGGIYSLLEPSMSLEILRRKMEEVNETGAEWVVTANTGCWVQLKAGVRLFGRGQRVLHVVEVLDEACRAGGEVSGGL